MLNMVSLLPHCKKDRKVEAKSSKGATLYELVERKGSSSCLFCRESDHNNISGTTTMSSQGYTHRRTAADNFLYSETEKSDYDWLVTPPGSPSKSSMNQLDTPGTNPMDLISLLGNCLEEESDNVSSKSRTIGLKRPSSSNGSGATTSRPSTPTKRSTMPSSRITSNSSSATLTSSSSRSMSRPSTPTRRPSSSIASRSALTSNSTNSSRSTSRTSTPTKRPSSSGTSRADLTASRVTSSTTCSRSMSRPSTPTNRPSSSGTSRTNLTASRVTSATCSSRSMSRPSTPTNTPPSYGTSRANLTSSRVTSATSNSRSTSRPSTPTSRPPSSGTSRTNLTAARTTTSATSTRPMTAPSTPTRRPSTPTGSSSVLKSKPTKPVSIPAPSPILRSRPWEPYEMPGFDLEAPSNLRTTLPDRPQTASSRGTRASGVSSVSSSRSTSIEPVVARRPSSSPSRSQAPNAKGGGPSVHGRREKTSKEDSGLSPVAMGNQMVERGVNMRKLAPPRVTENRGRGGGSSAVKSSSRSDGFGFGRNLSQSSIDMALRHLGVKRGSTTGNLRPLGTKVSAASMYSVRSSGTSSNRPVSSSGSSESSVNILCLDDDNLSDISYS